MLVFPNCKINLGLRIINKRADGYHNLETIFYPLPFHDALELVHSTTPPDQPGNVFTCSGISIGDATSENLCVKAWILNLSGQPEAALDCQDQSLRINPFSPDNCLLDVGVAQYSMQRYQQSAETFGQMSSWDLLRYACLAACFAQLGQDAEAHAATARALELIQTEYAGRGGNAIHNWLGYVKRMFRFAKQDDWNRLLAGFRMAGMPV